MNHPQEIADERHLIKEISQIECLLVEAMCNDAQWLNKKEESTLRWALSLARVSSVVVDETMKEVKIDHATDRYRTSLFNTVKPFINQHGEIHKPEIRRFTKAIGELCRDERIDLLQLYQNQLSKEALDDAVRTRPFALALGGGGGTAFVYLGAFEALSRAHIVPDAISGTSMGAILGAYRARAEAFSLDELAQVIKPIRIDNLARPFKTKGKFSVPATFKLALREVFSEIFENGNSQLRLRDLKIPFRACVGGLTSDDGKADSNLEEYAHLLDQYDGLMFLKRKETNIVGKLLDFANRPLKAIYFGSDEESLECNVVDALGFSCAVPGIFHYDIPKDDERMQKIIKEIMNKHGVYRLIDGGWIDNLPSGAAVSAISDGKAKRKDPFVLALDGFASNSYRHILFLPIMQMAAQNSRIGREIAHRTIAFEHVLSPLNLVPGKNELMKVIESGIQETSRHIPFIKKMLEPINDPPFLSDI